jgi:SAM-dependent methyltransferase
MTRHRELYRAEALPVFQNRMFHSQRDAIDCPKGDVVLVQDMKTGLVFNAAFDPSLMQYDADYQNEQAVSAAFKVHLEDVSNILNRHFAGLSLIEVGCGKGYFLEHLQALGADITGLDPTYEGTNPAVIREYFTPEVGLQGEGIILRHVLEHIRDPAAFLSEIRQANGGAGKIYIEVPCFDWIVEHKSWFDVFYEHVNYFRLGDFDRIFGTVYESGHVFGGQYLYVVADLASVRTPVGAFEPAHVPADFLGTVARYADRLKTSVGASTGTPAAAVWGGASKGVIFSLFMRRAGAPVETVIDINPAKQGKYLAATGLRVQSPDDALAQLPPGSTIYIMNANYFAEIAARGGDQYNYVLVERGEV